KRKTTRSSLLKKDSSGNTTKGNSVTKQKGNIGSDGNGGVMVAEASEFDEPNIDSRELLRVLTEVRNGNFSVRMPFDRVGLSGKICDTINDIISLNERMVKEFTKAGEIIGKQGKLNQRIEVPDARGLWSHGVDSLNTLISD